MLVWTILVALIVPTNTLFHLYPVEVSASYVVHSPITIVGNSGFTQQNGVTGGSGKSTDPYFIEGWSIASIGGQAAISISSTTAYFLIDHVQLLNAQPGIYLTGVTNGSVENSTLTSSDFGIRISSSTNVAILGNNISGPFDGVYVADPQSAPQTTGLTIANNTFSRAGVDVSSSHPLASNLNITGNIFLSTGISASFLGANVVRNTITGGDLTVGGNYTLVSNNTISGGSIRIFGSYSTARNNTADRLLLSGTNITISDNTIANGLLIPDNPPFDTPPFYDSHIMTGNTVSGKPLLYIASCSGTRIDGATAGEVIVANCTNVEIANLTLSGADEEIMMTYVHNASVVGNNLFGSNLSGNRVEGIDILHSSDLLISRNDLNGAAVAISKTDNVTLTGNVGAGSNFYAMIGISDGNNISVSSNTLENQGSTALSLVDSTSGTLVGNWISDSQTGVFVGGVNGLNITGNNLIRNGIGLMLGPGSLNGIFNSVIYRNNFVDSGQHQAVFVTQVIGAFDNGYPSGGNYWSDNRPVDNCSGPQQNICSGPDGIGDTAYTGIWEQFSNGGASGIYLDHYPLVDPYGNFSWDKAAPRWPTGNAVKISILNSTSLTFTWTAAVDDAWVSGYRVYQDSTLIANLPRYVQNYTVGHLSPGSTHVFKIEAGDPARNWSTDGPSLTSILPQAGNAPSTDQPFFSLSWWMENWYLGVLIGGSVGLAVVGVLLTRKRKHEPRPETR